MFRGDLGFWSSARLDSTLCIAIFSLSDTPARIHTKTDRDLSLRPTQRSIDLAEGFRRDVAQFAGLNVRVPLSNHFL